MKLSTKVTMLGVILAIAGTASYASAGCRGGRCLGRGFGGGYGSGSGYGGGRAMYTSDDDAPRTARNSTIQPGPRSMTVVPSSVRNFDPNYQGPNGMPITNVGQQMPSRYVNRPQPINVPGMNLPPQNLPPQNFPPQNYPPQNLPPRNYVTRNGLPANNTFCGPGRCPTGNCTNGQCGLPGCRPGTCSKGQCGPGGCSRGTCQNGLCGRGSFVPLVVGVNGAGNNGVIADDGSDVGNEVAQDDQPQADQGPSPEEIAQQQAAQQAEAQAQAQAQAQNQPNVPGVMAGGPATIKVQNPGTEQGKAILELNEIGIEATIDTWSTDKVAMTLPSVGLSKPTPGLLTILRADGEIARQVQVMVMPYVEQQEKKAAE